MVEEAFRLNVKWSLQELCNAIKGDGKAAPNPLFKVKVVLNNAKVSHIQKVKATYGLAETFISPSFTMLCSCADVFFGQA